MKNMVKINHKKIINNHFFKSILLCFSFLFLMFAFVFCFENFVFKNYEMKHRVAYAENIETQTKRYAKAKENCYLFKTSDVSSLNANNIYFCVPKTYFVTILAETNSAVFKVEYKGKIGFVSSDSVIVSSFIPIVPTLDDVFVDVSSVSGTQLRSSPFADNSSNVIKNIGAGTKNLEYVSFVESSKPIGGNSKIWYYVIYYPNDDPTAFYEGYIYSEKTTNMTSFSDNLENNPEIEKDDVKTNVSGENNIKIVLLVLILLPAILVFVLVAFRSRKLVKPKEQNNENESENVLQRTPRKSVETLKGKHFVKKQNDEEIETEFETEVSGISPRFPTYDIVDDDDLL